MAFSLITPTPSNFLKDWPAQNATNCDAFDTAAGSCLLTHPLGTYTPVLTASTTNPTLGLTPVVLGYYYLVFDMVFVYTEIRFGTSSSRGSGLYSITLPFKVKSLIYRTGFSIIGNGQVYSNATAASRQPVVTVLASTNTVRFNLKMGGTGSRVVSEGIPFVFADLDGIMFCARYQRDTS